MMQDTYMITLSPEVTVDDVWELLAIEGAEFLFSEEDQSNQKIYLRCDKSILKRPEILSVESYTIPEIDWEAQWEGKNELSLAPFGFPNKIIYMSPGSGFGDLSHPTTTVVCRMMSGLVKGKKVLDVGSGSGILSFAALEMGASEAIGVEIDLGAIEHANVNAVLNGLDVQFFPPEQMNPYQPDILLMNMIFSEQQVAWKSLKISQPLSLITSGILIDQKREYLKWAESLGWMLQECVVEDQWLGFYFKK